jgi:hypothetical protein
MGSELLILAPEPGLDGVRDWRVGVGAEDGLRGVTRDAGGAMVSCSALRSFESMVAAALRSSAPPHVEQNRPLEETCAPQEEQYMGGEILPPREASQRTGSRARDAGYEIRSTWTAVP